MRLSQIAAACRRAGITSYEHVTPNGETLRLTFGPAPEQPSTKPQPEEPKPAKKVRPKLYDLMLADEAPQ